ncbi:hypothetical protein D910_03568 [Dendroctonus ponderosae]|uniref:RUN and TBC1 domain-containing protein 3 n=1 Tax=Dendroctonus ponderosae TaxID=77166 RepID=U4U883_DENPD|nr:hypothetical protein D910_03568 [Dendroctonus ponderosae]
MDLAKSLFEGRSHDGYVGKADHNKRELELAIEPDDADDSYVDHFNGLNMEEVVTPTPGGPFSALIPSLMNSDFESRKKMVQSKIQTSFLAFRLLKILNIALLLFRLQWVAHLEFAHNKEVSELTWDKVEVRIPRTDKLLQMVRSGIPHSLRSQMWMRMSGALEKKQHSELCYKEILRMSSNDSLMTSKQIEKDLLHIMPTNACYSNAHSTGIPRLRRILRGVAWLYPDIGYCQGLGIIAASLLLFIEEENAFWIMVTIVEDLLPASYYSSTLLGIQADQKVLRNLISNYLPDTDEVLRNHDIELSLITMQWFLTLYANVVHTKILLRIWDLFFFEGSLVLFQITLAMLKIQEPHLKTLENSAQIFNALSDIPGDIEDVDKLLEGKCKFEKANNFHESLLETPKSVGMDQNAFVDDNTMSIDEPVQLYCEKLSPENNDSKMFKGWFPAKFVQLLDERSKQYSSAGDDSISETITDLVRGVLCPVIKQVFEHGMKRPNFLSSPCHPWLFIEEAATKEVEKDFNSVYSRLVLCKTYRLDEDGKVLTPEELLYRCVQSVNLSHDNAHAQMDVKLRSLICIGLNEQVLHLWLEVLCSSSEIVQKWYHPWSFIYSPGWVQIKCELRILSQLSFNLNPDWELPVKREANNQPLKEGVRDMLVKHHLFSWDI